MACPPDPVSIARLPLREKREAPSLPLGASARHAMEYGA